MIPSQRRDGVFTFNMQYFCIDAQFQSIAFACCRSQVEEGFFQRYFFPQLDVIIYVPEAAKNMIAN